MSYTYTCRSRSQAGYKAWLTPAERTELDRLDRKITALREAKQSMKLRASSRRDRKDPGGSFIAHLTDSEVVRWEKIWTQIQNDLKARQVLANRAHERKKYAMKKAAA